MTQARDAVSTGLPVPAPPRPLGERLIDQWCLDPAITFLNHGCFGARPRVVAEAQARWRERFESQPVHLLDRCRDELIEEAKAAVGAFIGAAPADFGFMTNATAAVNAVLRSFRFEPGDEVLTTTHVYNAVHQTMRYVMSRAGGAAATADLPLPLSGPDEVVERVEAAITPRTRLVIIDQVTSPTAVKLPVKALIARCRDRGIDVLVDGAHAPGMLELDVEHLGATYYTGNLHKWTGAPVGCAFLWVQPDRQGLVHPNVISHFYGESLAAEFSWQGTRDISAWLCAPVGIEQGKQLGWDRIRRHNHELAVWVQTTLSRAWDVPASTPLDGSMLGSMATLPLPDAARARFDTFQAVHDHLYDAHRIEVPVFEWQERWWIRPCCQVYNRAEEYERLGEVVGGW